MDVILIKNGVVENVICADSVERAQEVFPDYQCLERFEADLISPGWLYDGSTFSAPAAVVVPPVPISKLDFLNRFSSEQRQAIHVARAAHDPVVMDAMYMLDCATEVDLSHDDTIAFVNYMAQAGFIAADDVQRILTC